MSLPEQLSTLFGQALEIPDRAEREAFVAAQCADDQQLRSELEQMLRVHAQASGFLSTPPGEDALLTSDASVGRASVLCRLSEQLKLSQEKDGGQDSDTRPITGTTVGRYQLQGEIARGGMGAIVKCRDIDLGRSLALKVLLQSHADNVAVTERFIEEAQIGGQLQHPGVAPVYELGKMPDERPFFSMKLVKGDTLAALLLKNENGRERSRLLGIFEQVCQTMAYAHSRHVIHRDLKPANIMVGAFGEVQVMDWGLAKVLKVGGIADEKRARDTKLGHSLIQTVRSDSSFSQASVGTKNQFGSSAAETQAGSVMGTPAYMPPEQALGEVDRLDERCDVFGLGAILCEILTGFPPYLATETQDLFRQAARGHLTECFERLDACGADSALVELAKQCLAPELEDRLRNAAELSERMTEHLESVEQRLRQAEVERAAQATKTIEERKRRYVSTAFAASLVLMATIFGAGWIAFQTQAAEQTKVATARVREHVNDAKLHQGLAESKNVELKSTELEKAMASAELAERVVEQDARAASLQPQVTELVAQLNEQAQRVQEQLAIQSKEQRIKDRLEFIRLTYADAPKALASRKNGSTAGKQYQEVFGEAGIDVVAAEEQKAAQEIRAAGISESLIAGLDHWTSLLPVSPGYEIINAAEATGDWQTGIAAARIACANLNDSSPLPYMDWAVHALMADDTKSYRQACEAIRNAYSIPDRLETAIYVAKTCLLAPTDLLGVSIEQLPTEFLENVDQDVILSDEAARYLPTTRALLAYRRGHWQACLEYLREYADGSREPLLDAFQLGLQAICQYHLGNQSAAGESMADLDVALAEIGSNKKYAASRDALIAFLLRREAAALLGSEPLTFAEWTDGRDVTVAKAVLEAESRRRKLADIANLADSNEWRKSVRTALVERDQPALMKLAEAEKVDDQSPDLIAWFASELRAISDEEKATSLLRAVYEQHPDDFFVNYELGQCLALQGETDETLGFARAAVALRPDSIGATLNLSIALENAERSEESNALFEQLLSAHDWTEEDLSSLGRDLNGRAHFEKAATVERHRIAKGHDVGDATFRLALNLERLGRDEEAVEQANKAIEIDESLSGAYFVKAMCLTRLGRLEEAEQAYRQQIDSVSDGSVNQGRAYNNLGLVLRAQGKLKEAAEYLRKAVRQNPTAAHVARRNLIQTLREMAREEPLEPEWRRELSQLNAQLLNTNRTAVSVYRQRLLREPRNTEIRLRLVDLLKKEGDLDAALREANRAVALDNKNADVRYELGRLLVDLDQLDEAIARLREAIELDDRKWVFHATLGQTLVEKATGQRLHTGFNSLGPPKLNLELDEEQQVIVDEAIELLERAYSLAEEIDDSRLSNGNLAYSLQQLLELRKRDDEAARWNEKLQQVFESSLSETTQEMLRQNGIQQISRPQGIVAQALELKRQGKTDEALKLVDDFGHGNPDLLPGVLLVQADLLLETSQESKAADVYRRLLVEFPEYPIGYVAFATLLRNQGNLVRAEEVLREGLKKEMRMTIPVHLELSEVYVAQGKQAEGVEQLNQALRENANNPYLARKVIETKFEYSGDLDAAIKQAEEAAARSGLSVGKDLLALLLVLEVDSAGNLARLNEALVHARDASESPRRKMSRLTAFFLPALQQVYRSSEASSWSFSGSNTLGIVHYRRGEFEPALQSLTEFHEAGFLEPSNWLFLAMTHHQLGNTEQAIQWYEKAKAWLADEKPSRIESMFYAEAKALFEDDAP